MKKIKTIAALIVFLSAGLMAETGIQTPDESPALRRGADENGVFSISAEDRINLANGSLSISVPLGQPYPVGGGLSYQFSLSYSSNTWDYQEDSCVHLPGQGSENYTVDYVMPIPNPLNNAGMGWMLNFGRLLQPAENGGVITPLRPLHNWIYVDQSGARRTFSNSLSGNTQINTSFTNDGTFIRMTPAGSSSDPDSGCGNPPEQSPQPHACRRLEFPDGTVHEFYDVGTTEHPDWRVTRIRDLKNNYVNFNYQENSWTIRDKTNRTHTVFFDEQGQLETVELASYGGQTATYTMQTSDHDIVRHKYQALTSPLECGQSGSEFTNAGNDEQYGHENVPLLNHIINPDNSFYAFDYGNVDSYEHTDLNNWHPPNDQAGESSGSLKSMRTPTGLRKEWTYGRYTFIHFNRIGHFTDGDGQLLTLPSSSKAVSGVYRKDHYVRNSAGMSVVPRGRWLYQYSNTGVVMLGGTTQPCYFKNIVTDPMNRQVIHYFNGNNISPGFVSGMDNLPFTTCNTDGSTPGVLEPPFLSEEHLDESNKVFKRVYVEYKKMSEGGFFDIDTQLTYRMEENYDLSNQMQGMRFTETVFSDYDGLGHFREITSDGDYWQSIQADNHKVSHQFINMNSTDDNVVIPARGRPWLLNKTTGTILEDSSAYTHSVTFCYADPKSPQWTGQRIYTNGLSASESDQLRIRLINAQGYIDTELYYGGDNRRLPTAHQDCSQPPSSNNPSYKLVHQYAQGVIKQSSYHDQHGQYLKLFNHRIDHHTGLASVLENQYGVVTVFSYDNMGRLLSQRTGNNAKLFLTYTYPTQNNPGAPLKVDQRICEIVNGNTRKCGNPPPNDPGHLIVRDHSRYNDLGQLIEIRQHLPDDKVVFMRMQYDSIGRKTAESDWFPSGAQAEFWTRYQEYDYLDRVGGIKLPDGRLTEYSYTGDWIKQTRQQVMVGEDQTGSLQTAVTNQYTDAYGRNIYTRQKKTVMGNNLVTTQRYNVNDQVVQICRNDSTTNNVSDICANNGSQQSRIFQYDGRGHLATSITPEQGQLDYDYDAAGQPVTQHFNAAGIDDLEMVYDAGGRLTRLQTQSANSRVLKEFYYARSDSAEKGWVQNRLVLAKRHNLTVLNGAPKDVVISEAYRYQQTGSKRLEEYAVRANLDRGLKFVTNGFVYDQTDNITSMQYPSCTVPGCEPVTDGSVLNMVYQQMELIAIPGYVDHIGFNHRGSTNSITHSNQVTDTFQHNFTDELEVKHWSPLSSISIKHNNSNQLLWESGTYHYDSGNNIIMIGAQSYRYDLLGRMRYGETATSSGIASQQALFDDFDNLTELNNTNAADIGPGIIHTEPRNNRLTSHQASYDQRGNLKSIDLNSMSVEFDYDALGMMTQLSKNRSGQAEKSYLYSSSDKRVATLDHTQNKITLSIRNGGAKVLSIFDLSLREQYPQLESMQRKKDYIYAGAQQVASTANNITQHFHRDHLGSTRLITDEFGAVISHHDFLPFGGYAQLPEQFEQLQFTGHERDRHGDEPAMDLDYMLARYYSPYLGRFLSPDPALDGWNLYTYVGNNPMNLVDPTGLQTATPSCSIADKECTEDVPRPGLEMKVKLPGMGVTIGVKTDIGENNSYASSIYAQKSLISKGGEFGITSNVDDDGITSLRISAPLIGTFEMRMNNTPVQPGALSNPSEVKLATSGTALYGIAGIKGSASISLDSNGLDTNANTNPVVGPGVAFKGNITARVAIGLVDTMPTYTQEQLDEIYRLAVSGQLPGTL